MTTAEATRMLEILIKVARVLGVGIKMMLDTARQVEPELRKVRLPEEDDAMRDARDAANERITRNDPDEI